MALFFFSRALRWIWVAIGALFLVVGVVALVSFLFGPSILGLNALTPAPSSFARPYFFFFFPFGLWGFVFVAFVIFLGLRWLLWPWRRNYYYGGGGRYRYYYGRDPALQALRERYARGEISKEQFEQMLRDLRSNQ